MANKNYFRLVVSHFNKYLKQNNNFSWHPRFFFRLEFQANKFEEFKRNHNLLDLFKVY